VAYYHVCTSYDDWGTMPEHWREVDKESPAPGYMNRFFVRCEELKPDEWLRDAGVLCVTFYRGAISSVSWQYKPAGIYKHPEEDYIHRDDLPKEVPKETPKPEGYGDWA
jgi:hypothetical protein